MAKSFLLIGGSSDIAQILARELLDSGHLVTLLARDVARISHLKDMGADIIEGDALDEAVVSSAVEHAKGRSEDGLSGAAHLVGSIALRPPHATKLEDFEAVIQSAQKKTDVNPENTIIYGRSAGGYLVGATLARNATGNLFRTLYTEVPYLDVLSTASNPRLPLTQLEYEEFGDPLHKEKNALALLRLSPVNTIPESGAPAIFVLCRIGLNDKEVFAYESVKWITRLRENEGKPKLLAISEGEGHFISGRSSFRERAEDLALLLSNVARRFSRDKTKKSKHRIYNMALSRRNRKNNMMSRKNRKNNNINM